MDSNAGVAVAASSIATSVAIAEMQREEEEAKGRRIENEGKDQIVLETTKNIDRIGEEIASEWVDYYYNSEEEAIYSKTKSMFGFGTAIGVSLFSWAILGLIWFVGMVTLTSLGEYSSDAAEWFPINFPISIVISIIIGIIAGFIFHPNDEQIEWIRMTKLEKGKMKTRVLIKRYDNRGYRYIDEDELIRIKEQM
jgi:hypothetical protein